MELLMRWVWLAATVGLAACVYDEECVRGYVEVDGTCVPADGGAADADGLDGGVDGGAADGAVDGSSPDAAIPARLRSLELVGGILQEPFDPEIFSYTGFAGALTDAVQVRATAAPDLTIAVEGAPVTSGELSEALPLSPDSTRVTVVVTSPGGAMSTYTVDITKGAGTYFKHQAPEVSDYYGSAIDLDGATLVVGVPGDDAATADPRTTEESRDSGAVFVYERSDEGWRRTAFLKTRPVIPAARFGGAVAVDGDTLVVGAVAKDSNTGATYVFERTEGSWELTQLLAHPFPNPGDFCGGSVAVDGDVVAVACAGDPNPASGVQRTPSTDPRSFPFAGSVLIFRRRSTGRFELEAYVKPHNPGQDDRFGQSIALLGDHLVVGAIEESTNAAGVNDASANNDNLTRSGAAYLFRYDPVLDTWSEVAFLKALEPDEEDRFGLRVGISPDWIVVASTVEASGTGEPTDDSTPSAGAVYAYPLLADGSVGAPVYLKSPAINAEDQFGQGLAIEGDRLVVGAPGEDSNASGVHDAVAGSFNSRSVGAAYEYRLVGGNWVFRRYIKPLRVETDNPTDRTQFGYMAKFGWAVAISHGIVAISAEGDASSATGIDGGGTWDFLARNYSGAVYVY